MKTKILMTISLVFLLLVGILTSFANEPIDTVRLYLEALQKGDVQRLQTYLGDPLYSQRQRLLSQNTEYGEFLRKFYAGAEFSIGENNPAGNSEGNQSTKSVMVIVEYSDGNRSVITLRLHKSSSGPWKIVGEN